MGWWLGFELVAGGKVSDGCPQSVVASGGFVMFAVDVCSLPATGSSTFVLVASLFLLVAGVIVARWVRRPAGRLSVVVAPLVLLGGLVLAPQAVDPCAPATTVPSVTTTVAPTTTTTTSTTTTLAPVDYQVGATGPSGGIIFYKDLTRPAGSQYFEVACAGWSDGTCGGNDGADPTAVWGCFLTPITGVDGTLIGIGEQNTTEIVNPVTGCSTPGIAAQRASALVLGGQSDWFLPSKDELNALCKWAFNDTAIAVCNNDGAGDLSLTGVGSFSTGPYWSSSEDAGHGAWYQFFDYGHQTYGGKNSTYYVRPVRAF